jgi:ATP-dependent RNA helicase DDX24/MAK5
MMEKGHFLEVHKIIEKINSKASKITQRQIFVFSATLTFVHDIPDYLQRKINANTKSNIMELVPFKKLQKLIKVLKMQNPKIIDITKTTGMFF